MSLPARRARSSGRNKKRSERREKGKGTFCSALKDATQTNAVLLLQIWPSLEMRQEKLPHAGIFCCHVELGHGLLLRLCSQFKLMQSSLGSGILSVPCWKIFPKVRSPPSLLSHTVEVRGSPSSGQDLLGVKLPRREKRAAINLHILWRPESEMREVGISSFQPF